MAYNHGKEERKWRLWKEAEEKILRAYGVDENIIEEIRIYDRAEFNSDRRFYRRLNDMEEYIEKQVYIGNCLIENAGVFHQRDFRYVTANRKSYLQENGQAAEKIKNI